MRIYFSVKCLYLRLKRRIMKELNPWVLKETRYPIVDFEI